MSSRSPLLPSLAVAASGLIWGVWWLPLRQLEGAGLGGNWANVAVFALAALLSAPFAYVARRGGQGRVGDLVIIGILSGVSLCLWNYALLTGNVVRVTLLWYLAPVWCTGLSLIVFRERLGLSRVVTILGGLAGAAVLLGLDAGLAGAFVAADAVALISSLMFAMMTIYVRKTGAAVGGWEKTFFTAVFATLAALVAVALLPPSTPPAAGLFLAAAPQLLLCMVWQLAVMWLFMWGSAYLESGRVAIYLLLEVVGAVISAAILTAEPFGAREVCGCLLIVGAGLIEGLDELRRGRTVALPQAGGG